MADEVGAKSSCADWKSFTCQVNKMIYGGNEYQKVVTFEAVNRGTDLVLSTGKLFLGHIL